MRVHCITTRLLDQWHSLKHFFKPGSGASAGAAPFFRAMLFENQ
jgi:hypothetical protein